MDVCYFMPKSESLKEIYGREGSQVERQRIRFFHSGCGWLALLIRTAVVQAFYIPSGSMEDTLLVGDYLLATKFVYGAPIDVPGTNVSLFRFPALRDPAPGDIVIFKSPQDANRDLIKRCVATGGQTVEIVNKTLYVDGQPL